MDECVRKMTLDEAIENARKVVNSCHQPLMTFETMNSIVKDNCREEHEQLAQWLEELKEYKELEEQGRLLKLQCNVGTEVFAIFPIGDHYEKCQIKKIEIRSTVLEKIRYFVEPIAHRGCSFSYFDNEFEKHVFLTKEEAEAKLKEMETSTE